MNGRAPGEPALLAFALASSVLLWAACGRAFGVVYGSNDDPARAMIVSGTGTASAPDEHLPFSNVLVGRALRALYQRWPGEPWYDRGLAGVAAVAHAVLAYAGLRAAPGRTALVLYAVWLGVSLGLATTLQFTLTAFAAAQAGLLLGASLAVRPAAGRARWLVCALAILAAWTGAMVRADAFWLALALSLPPMALLARAVPPRRLAPFALVAGVAVVSTLVAEAYDRRYYARDPAWSAARAYQAAVHEVLDLRRPDEAEPGVAAAIRRAGWSRNDFRLFQAWFYPDEVVFSRDRLTSFLQGLPPAEDRLGRARDALRRVWGSPLALRVTLAIVAAALVLWPGGRHVSTLGAAVAAAAAALLCLALWRKLPGHVWGPVVLFPVAWALATRPGDDERQSSPRTTIALVLALAGVAWAVGVEWQERQPRRAATAAFLESLARVPRPEGEAVLVTWAPTFPYDVAPTFAGGFSPPGLRLFSLGWPHRTPAAQATLDRLGAHDLARALAWDPRLSIAAPREAAPLLERYILRHAGTRVRFVVAADTPSFTVLKATGAEAAAPEADAHEVGESGLMLESAAPVQR